MDIKEQKRVSRLIAHHILDELEENERKELDAWRSSSLKNENLFQEMLKSSHWIESMKYCTGDAGKSEKEWMAIRKRTVAVRSRAIRKRAFGMAAVCILLLSLGGGLLILREYGTNKGVEPESMQPGCFRAVLEFPDNSRIDLKDRKDYRLTTDAGLVLSGNSDSLTYRGTQNVSAPEWHLLRVPRGGEYRLTLSDGTRVFLNAGSVLKYPVCFTDGVRRVVLEGEAYFEVERDESKPFIVEARQLEIEVLGTSFGLYAYPGESDILTTLVSGKLKVGYGDKEVLLSPEEQAVFDGNTGGLSVRRVDTELYVGWKDGRLVFDNSPLEQVLNILSRWYSFELRYENPEVRHIPYSLNIKKYEKIAGVLELLEQTGKVKFTIDENTVVVK